MKDALEAFEKLLKLLKLPITTWSVILFLAALLFKDRLKRLWDQALDSLSAAMGGEWSYRRFEPKYREFVRSDHLYMRLVGIRTEEERQPTITDAYVPISLAEKAGGVESSASIDQVARDNGHVLILGDPGAGKSTLLAQLIISFTNPRGRTNFYRKCRSIPSYIRGTDRQPLPVYVALRRCAGRNRSLRDDILDPGTKILSTPVIENMSRGFLDRAFRKGRAILLLDGLDEVADQDSYQDATRKINEFKQSWPLVRIVVTCRKAGWRGGLHPDFRQFVALSLDSGQQYDFAHKWYAAILRYTSFRQHRTEQDLLARGSREADKLLGLIAIKERLREIASNPMILGLICLVHYRKKNLPRGRAAIYDECIEILIDLWDRIDKDLDQAFPSTEQKKLLLRRIAHHMHIKGLTEIERHEVESLVLGFLPDVQDQEGAAEVVRELEVRSGLMVERSIDVLNFSHLTFQEFLLVDYFRSEPGAHLSIEGITDWSSWREPVLLMCGVENNPVPLLRKLFEFQPTLAILGISEMDPTQINEDVEHLVKQAIDKVYKQALALADGVPALVGLLSVEGNPFGTLIEGFIYSFAASRHQEMGNLVEALGKIPTQEAASILLSLLTSSAIPEAINNNLVAGLARIGDPAMYESEDWLRKGKIDNDLFFRIIAACDSIHSTELLWTRYGLEPPPGHKGDWAMAWSLRLARAENDKIVRDQRVHLLGGRDTTIWPYPSATESAVAAIIQRSVQILHDQYPSLTPLVSDADRVSSMSLRVQVPLLVKAVAGSPRVDDKTALSRLAEQQKILGAASPTTYKLRFLAPELGSRTALSSEEYEQLDRLTGNAAACLYLRQESPLDQVFNQHSWETLGGFLARKSAPKRGGQSNLPACTWASQSRSLLPRWRHLASGPSYLRTVPTWRSGPPGPHGCASRQALLLSGWSSL